VNFNIVSANKKRLIIICNSNWYLIMYCIKVVILLFILVPVLMNKPKHVAL
jgi:hypothetical protein